MDGDDLSPRMGYKNRGRDVVTGRGNHEIFYCPYRGLCPCLFPDLYP